MDIWPFFYSRLIFHASDIVFVVDSTYCSSRVEMESHKEFIHNLLHRFSMGSSGGTRVSLVVSFSILKYISERSIFIEVSLKLSILQSFSDKISATRLEYAQSPAQFSALNVAPLQYLGVSLIIRTSMIIRVFEGNEATLDGAVHKAIELLNSKKINVLLVLSP